MKTKLFTLTLLLTCLGAAKAAVVEIGDGSSSSKNLPSYFFYNYGISQQIYTSSEIGVGGTINSIALKNVGAEKNRTYVIYMSHTSKESFSSGSDWVAMSDADKVFSGEVTFTSGEWTTIEFSTPFTYNGSSNLIVTVVDNTGSYTGSPGMSCLVFDATRQAIYAYRDNSPYDVGVPGVSGNLQDVKNQILLGFSSSSSPILARPTSITITEITANSVGLSWQGGTGTYNLEFKKSTASEWTREASTITRTTYTLGDLEANTTYNVRVQSVSGSNTSTWRSLTFTMVNAIPYTETFDGSSIPNGWSRYSGLLSDVLSGGQLTVSSSGWNVSKKTVFDSHAVVNIYGTGCRYWLVSPLVMVESGAYLSFDVAFTSYYNLNTSVPDDKFVVLASADNGATWTVLRQWDNAGSADVLENISATGEKVYIDLSSYVGKGISIAFYAESTVNNADSNLHIDNLTIDNAFVSPSVKVDNTTTNTATVSWSSPIAAGQVTYDLRHKMENDTWEYVDIVSGLTSTSYTITDNLFAGGFYEVQVRSHSSNGVSEWSDPVLFATQCSSDDMADVHYQLTDSYGDGWESNAIQIRYAGTNIIAATLTLPKGASAEGTVKLCYGRDYDFVWKGGTYSNECGFTITCGKDEIISHTAGTAPKEGVMTTYYVSHYNFNCGRPADLTITEGPGPDYVILSWKPGSAEQTSWDVVYVDMENPYSDMRVDRITDNPYRMQGLNSSPLQPEHTYKVKVRGSFGTLGYSNWSSEITFTTPCENPIPTNVQVDAQTQTATFTWTGYSYRYKVYYRKKGTTAWSYQFAYTPSCTLYLSYGPDEEYEYKIAGLTYSGEENAGTGIRTFTLSEPIPVSISVEPSYTTASVSWKGDADYYEVRYAQADIGNGSDDTELSFDNGEHISSVASNSGENLETWGVKFPGSMVTGNLLTKISIYEGSHNTGKITVKIYCGGDDAPGNLVYTQVVTPLHNSAFHEITLPNPVTIVPEENLWVILSETGKWVILSCDQSAPEGTQWMLQGDSWANLSSSCLMIRATINNADTSGFEWTTKQQANKTLELTNLEPNTGYVVQVRGAYGYPSTLTDFWGSTAFTTKDDNPVAADVDVTTTPNTATISWTGVSDSYQVRYRTAGLPETIYFTDFEDGLPSGWTTIDNDGDGFDWTVATVDLLCHSGSVCMYSQSYVNSYGILTPDNWLISPRLNLNGTVKVWLRGQDPSYAAEHFAIYVSTTGNTDVNSFKQVSPELVATSEYVEYTADLSSYAGKTGYVAIRHYNIEDMFILNLDDFGLYYNGSAASQPGEWVEVNTNDTSVTLSDLQPSTQYEFQIIGRKGGKTNAGTEPSLFSTATDNGIATDIDQVTGEKSQVTNDDWYTIDGQKLSGKPAKKGIYIRNGRKTVVR